MRQLVSRSLRTVLRAVEGSYRPGPYYLPVTGGWLPDGAATNWWQQGYLPLGGTPSPSAMVEACVSAYAQTIAMCPGDHWRSNAKGGRTRVTTSALSRILRYPNEYQSISDFLLNVTRSLYIDGNAYAWAHYNSRFEVDELHLMNPRMSRPQVLPGGEIFYYLGGNDVIAAREGEALFVPAREVLHVRLHTDMRYPRPLVGETPLMAAMLDVGLNEAILQQQAQFYTNQARPSAVLQTDMVLDKDQVQALRDRWDEQTRGFNQGKTPILTAGLKVEPWAMHYRDAQIAEMMKLSSERIALAFRVPLQVLGLAGGPSYGSAEALMQFWIASGLGFAINHIEEAIGLLYQLKGQPDEYVEFDTAALLRSAQKDRIEALARGVQGGIFSPNEARNSEGLDKVKAGDEPRVQQQVVPLSAAESITTPPTGHAPPGHIPPAPGPPAPLAAPPAPAKPPKDYSDAVKRSVGRVFASADRAGRHLN
jgi:HK97 family phage portal protein